MSDHPPPAGFVTLAEAVRRLGVSDRTIRRRVERGELEGEHVPRPQGTVLYVRLPEDAAPDAAPGGTPQKPEKMPEESRGNAGGEHAALSAALLERLDAANAALLAATERAARAEAARDAAREAAGELRRRLEDAEARLRRPWWRFWGPA